MTKRAKRAIIIIISLAALIIIALTAVFCILKFGKYISFSDYYPEKGIEVQVRHSYWSIDYEVVVKKKQFPFSTTLMNEKLEPIGIVSFQESDVETVFYDDRVEITVKVGKNKKRKKEFVCFYDSAQ